MNDILNKSWLELNEMLQVLNKDKKRKIMEKIESIIELEQKLVKHSQLVEIPARLLRKDDLIFDFYKKNIIKVHYVEYRRKCQFNIDEDNKEMLVSYGDEIPCDYFDENTKVSILIDIADLVNINKREDLLLEDF